MANHLRSHDAGIKGGVVCDQSLRARSDELDKVSKNLDKRSTLTKGMFLCDSVEFDGIFTNREISGYNNGIERIDESPPL